MAAWLWTGNPDKWKADPSTTGYKAMWAYLSDNSQYVYWATTKFHNKIEIGDVAYIWRSKSDYEARNGIVAIGEVEELPQEYTPASKHGFRYPDRLDALGWDEGRATSNWKTGIRIRDLRWSRPTHVAGLMVRESVNTVTHEQRKKIDAALAK